MVVVLSSFLLYIGFYNIAISSRNQVMAEVIKSLLSDHQKKFLKDMSYSELDSFVDILNNKSSKLSPEIEYEYNELDNEEIKKYLETIKSEREKKETVRTFELLNIKKVSWIKCFVF